MIDNPFIIGGQSSITKSEDLPLLKEYAYDFQHERLVKDKDGKQKVVTKNEALKVWIYKVLKTERWRYLAYHSEYGGELEQFIGKPNISAVGELMKIYIKDALMVNPYIEKIDKIKIIKQENDKIEIYIKLLSIYGYTHLEVII